MISLIRNHSCALTTTQKLILNIYMQLVDLFNACDKSTYLPIYKAFCEYCASQILK